MEYGSEKVKPLIQIQAGGFYPGSLTSHHSVPLDQSSAESVSFTVMDTSLGGILFSMLLHFKFPGQLQYMAAELLSVNKYHLPRFS